MRKVVLSLIGMLYVGHASAFGMMDILSAGLNTASKVGGAAIDKALEDSPEKVAEKQKIEKSKRDAQFKTEIAKIEADQSMPPLQKEKMIRQLSRSFAAVEAIANMQVKQDEVKRQERDKTLSLAGVASVAGGAVMNTPSMEMARADMAVKSGAQQQQSRDTLAKTDAVLNSEQVKKNGVAGVQSAVNSGVGTQPGIVDTLGSALSPAQTQGKSSEQVGASSAKMQEDVNAAKDAATKSVNKNMTPVEANLLAQDKGKNRKIFVEFVGGAKYTEQLITAFKSEGFTVVGNAKDADVIYLFDGEFSIDPESNRKGVTLQLGELSDTQRVIDLPKKEVSMFRGAALGLVSTLAGVKGAVAMDSHDLYSQQVLVVANRHFEGKDTRTSVLVSDSANDLVADNLIRTAMNGLASNVGLSKPLVIVSSNQVQASAEK